MKAIAITKAALSLLIALLTCAPRRINSQESRLVKMTLVRNASSIGAHCLDGSLPAYHLDTGFGAGAHNWLLQFEGGGWCNDIKSCSERAPTRRGSTRYMSNTEVFSGILSNNASLNPDFYNWNRVKLRYCDGASFAGDAIYQNGTSLLYFRGQRIWQAIILDLLPKGLGQAKKALLSGCSAGGLATFLHCDNFTSYLPKNASVKCLSDAGFFLDARDIAMNHSMRYFYKSVVSLQGVVKNLNKNCTDSTYPEQCFFPQYALPYIKTPFFVLNSAYDVFQLHHILVPPAADPHGHWYHCKLNPADCNTVQINTMQGFRKYMLQTLRPFFVNSTRGGMYINSCFTHCQSETQDTWFAPDSPRVHNKVLVHGSAEATEHLKQHCLKNVCPHVYAPQIEESIDVTSDLCAYKVQLSEKLMSNILFKKLGDYEIAWVDAEVGKTENGTLSLLPLSTPPPSHKTVLVGDLKMADFKQFLASKGIQVEFAGGALHCGEYVTLRKVGDSSHKGGGTIQHIILEGPLSEEYYNIRDNLYSQFYSL